MSTSTPPLAGSPEPIAPADTTPRLSEAERLMNVFVSPSKTFADLRRNPSWWVPFVIVAIFSYMLIFAVDNKVGWDTVTMNQMKQSPKQMEAMDQLKASDPQQYQQRMKIGIAATKYISFAYPIVALIINVIVAGILMATMNFGLGAEVKFQEALAVVYYASLAGVIRAVLATISLFAGSNPENFSFSNPVGTNIAYYLDISAVPRALYAIAGFIDVIGIWIVVLIGIGLATIGRKKISAGMAVAGGWYVLIALLSALGAMFR
jgi:hypothetical protein